MGINARLDRWVKRVGELEGILAVVERDSLLKNRSAYEGWC